MESPSTQDTTSKDSPLIVGGDGRADSPGHPEKFG